MKSLNSLHSIQSNHSRRSSETSEISSNEPNGSAINGSGGSLTINDDNDDDEIYQIWGQIINDWTNVQKKQKAFIQVRYLMHFFRARYFNNNIHHPV